MRTIKTLLITALILFSFTIFAQNEKYIQKRNYTKQEALDAVKEIKSSAKMHIKSIEKIERFAQKSDANFSHFVQYAKLASVVGIHTDLYVYLAEITSKLTEEKPILFEVVQIIENPQMSLETLEDITNQAIAASTRTDFKTVYEGISKYKMN